MDKIDKLEYENAELRQRLAEAKEALAAISAGQVDALVVDGVAGPRVFSLAGADHGYRVLVETMHEAALTVEPEGRILYCNPRFCELLDTPMPNTLGRRIADFAAPGEAQQITSLLATARSRPVQRRLALRRGDGTLVPVQVAASPLTSGATTSICLVAADLTELENSADSIRSLLEQQVRIEKAGSELAAAHAGALNLMEEAIEARLEAERAAAELHESQNWLRLALEGGGLGTWHRDVATGTVTRDERTQRILGWFSASEPDDLEFLDRVHPDDRAALIASRERSLSESSPQSNEFRMIKPDGTVVWLLNRSQPYADHTGKVVRISGICMDITARKETEEKLRQLNADLEQRVASRTAELQSVQSQLRAHTARLHALQEEARSQLATELHDEFGAALTALKIDLHWIIKHLPRRSDGLLQKARTMSSIIDDTVESMRRMAAMLRPRLLDDFGLVAAIEWQSEEFEKRTGTHVRLDLPENVPLDQQRATALFRILQEALTNVARHAKASEVAVRLCHEDSEIRLQVEDDGVGIDTGSLAGNNSFGLFGMKERAHAFGGSVDIVLKKSAGTRVDVRIPCGRQFRTCD